MRRRRARLSQLRILRSPRCITSAANPRPKRCATKSAPITAISFAPRGFRRRRRQDALDLRAAAEALFKKKYST